MYSGELSGSRELRKNTLKTIIGSYCKPASWHCSHRCFILALKLHLRLRTMLPLRSRSSSAKFDACLAGASTRKGQVALQKKVKLGMLALSLSAADAEDFLMH